MVFKTFSLTEEQKQLVDVVCVLGEAKEKTPPQIASCRSSYREDGLSTFSFENIHHTVFTTIYFRRQHLVF